MTGIPLSLAFFPFAAYHTDRVQFLSSPLVRYPATTASPSACGLPSSRLRRNKRLGSSRSECQVQTMKGLDDYEPVTAILETPTLANLAHVRDAKRSRMTVQ
jgi:hypothetical protein